MPAVVGEALTLGEVVRVARAFVGPDAADAGVREIPIPLHLIGNRR